MKTKETSKKRLCKYCFSTETCCTDVEAETCENLEKLDEETSTRELALAWWKLQGQGRQNYLTNTYIGNQRFSYSLTGREIEEIWKNEVQVKELSNAYHNEEYLEKPNQKPFNKLEEKEAVVQAINKFLIWYNNEIQIDSPKNRVRDPL